MAIFQTAKKQMLDAILALGTLKVMLLDASHTTDTDTQQYIDDVDADELVSAGYTAGGASAASITTAVNNTDDTVTLDFANLSWTGLTGTVRHAAVYVDTGNAATSPILTIQDLGSDQVLSADDLNLNLNASGLIKF